MILTLSLVEILLSVRMSSHAVFAIEIESGWGYDFLLFVEAVQRKLLHGYIDDY